MPSRGVSSRTSTPQVNTPDAYPDSIGAPLGGWNAAEVTFLGAKNDALLMENFIPGNSNVHLRKGYTRHVTGIGSPVRGLFAYQATTESLFAVTATGCYNVTNEGTIGAPAFAVTTPLWSFTNFSNGAGKFGVFVNGADSYRHYNGTTWTTVSTFAYEDGGPQTLPTTRLSFVTSHKFRLWFIEKGTLNAWYLASSAISGDAVRFPLGPLFPLGGSLHSIFTWTIDGGSGMDDYLCFLSTKGELVAYQGTDPASTSTWALVGKYFVGEPVGDLAPIKFGGDVLVLTTSGLLSLTKVVSGAADGSTAALTTKIHSAYTDALENHIEDVGWQAHLILERKLLLINVPERGGLYFFQYVMNIDTGAWCKFTNWNAFCWCNFNRRTFFGADNFIGRAFNGLSDGGSAIKGKIQHVFVKHGRDFQQHPIHARAHLRITRAAVIKYSFFKDYEDRAASTTLEVGSSGDKWDSAVWDTALWGEANRPFKIWDTPPTFPGFNHSFMLEVTTSNSSVIYTGADFLIQPVRSTS